jgi:glycosyltransferase involved in cell wall biosynthesis
VVVGTFVVSPPKAPRLVFDLFDDNAAYWRQYGRGKEYLGEIESVERAYLQAADAVVAASSVLADKAKPWTSHPIHFIPNAVDLKRFDAADGSAWRSKWNAPGLLAGVLGNYDKPDELQNVLDAAAILRDEEIYFIVAGRGSTVPGAKAMAAKRGLSKVQFVGQIPMPDAPDAVSAFDVGLCPYRKTPFADACSPMRLLLYTAAGLPTVCTDLEEVRRMNFPNVVLVRDDPESLADGIRRARGQPRARPAGIAEYDLPRLVDRYEQVLRG